MMVNDTLWIHQWWCWQKHGRKGKLIQNFWFKEDKSLPTPWWHISSIISLPPDSWLAFTHPKNGAILRIQYWFALLADLISNRKTSQVSFGKGMSMLSSACIDSIPATIATKFTGSLSKECDGYGERIVDISRVYSFSIWSLRISSVVEVLWWTFHFH